MKVITLNSVVPVRAEAAESAEMVTQMLFAETATVLEQTERWTKIKLDADGYEGWADRKMLSQLGDKQFEQLQSAPKAVVSFPVSLAVSLENKTSILLTGGTRLPNYNAGIFELLGVKFNIDASTVETTLEFTTENFMRIAFFYLNTPYLWGGKNALGMDCSGFTQIIYSIFGVQLPRDASMQVQDGKVVDFLVEAKTGDLAFFENADKKIIHVGILLDSNRIMHCSGRVKINQIDSQGIISEETGQYTHQLRVIKRIFGE